MCVSKKSTGQTSLFSLHTRVSEDSESSDDCVEVFHYPVMVSDSKTGSSSDSNCNVIRKENCDTKHNALQEKQMVESTRDDYGKDKVQSGFDSDQTKQQSKGYNRKYFRWWCPIIVVLLIAIVIAFVSSSNLQQQWCLASRSFDVSQLRVQLEEKVFGQHIAISVIYQAFDDFFQPKLDSSHQDHFSKSSTVVFSFHGWTGVGKNYVSNIISDLIPTASITKLIIPLHFPHVGGRYSKLHEQNIKEWILSNTSMCTVNLVIVDEMDKATVPLLKGLQSAIYMLKYGKYKESKTIIVLLSNTGGTAINNLVFSHFTKGYTRETVNKNTLVDAILNSDNVTWHRHLYEKHLIDYIVPFLPLENQHVQKCIKDYLSSRELTLPSQTVAKIAKEFEYFPKNQPFFSKTGCKRVEAKTDLFLYE